MIKEQAQKIVKTLTQYGGWKWERFNYCQAYTTNQYLSIRPIGENESINCQPIRSYDTIVGFADISNNIVYEVGKYSQTTSKQFTQICNQKYTGYKRALFR